MGDVFGFGEAFLREGGGGGGEEAGTFEVGEEPEEDVGVVDEDVDEGVERGGRPPPRIKHP